MKLQVILEDKKRGFTVVELLIVLAITLVVASVSIPIYGNFQKMSQLNDVSSSIVQTLRLAKNQSATGLNNSNHGVYFDLSNNEVVLYQGDSYSDRDIAYDRVVEYGSTIVISTDLIDEEIRFSKNSAKPDNYGEIIINHQNGGAKTITINGQGYVEEI